MSTTTPATTASTSAPDAEDMLHPRYSVVIPVYCSAPLLPTLVERLDAFFAHYPWSHEVIFVNDGSPDESWEVLERLKAERDDIVIIDLLRNYGQHSAVFCGLQHARGDFVITMDDDLQNPPEELIHLVRKAEEGHDVVFGAFHQKMHGPFRRLGSRVVSWLNVNLFNKPRGLVLTNFRIIRREVVDAVVSVKTTFPYIPGLVLMSAVTHGQLVVGAVTTVSYCNYNYLQIHVRSFPLNLSLVRARILAGKKHCPGTDRDRSQG